jgi:hypothetical protein
VTAAVWGAPTAVLPSAPPKFGNMTNAKFNQSRSFRPHERNSPGHSLVTSAFLPPQFTLLLAVISTNPTRQPRGGNPVKRCRPFL